MLDLVQHCTERTRTTKRHVTKLRGTDTHLIYFCLSMIFMIHNFPSVGGKEIKKQQKTRTTCICFISR